MKCFWGLVAAVLVLLAGCHADIYYQKKAAEDAADFLVKNCPELSDEQKQFVRYNRPVLLFNQVLRGSGGEMAMLRNDVKQICVAWKIPETDKLYMVYGVSDGSMKWWQPVRMVKKNLHTGEPVLSAAVASAREYARNFLRDKLTAAEMNQVRFLPPFLCRTDFEINFNVTGELDDNELDLARKAVAGKTQYALIWKFGGRELVFSGFADAKMAGWKIFFVALLSPEETGKHTVRTLMRPEDYLQPFPEEETAAPAAETVKSGAESVDM